MKNQSKAPLLSYIAAPLMILVCFSLASLVFTFIVKDPSPVPVFMVFATVQVLCMLLSAALPSKGKAIARSISKFIIGSFILILAGILGRNNFQLEGFFLYAITGTMSGVLVHFLMGKIAGPLLWGRTWCSWGCWSAMIFDLLPFRKDTVWKRGALPKVRYFHFGFSLVLIIVLYYVFKKSFLQTDPTALNSRLGTVQEMTWFMVGNGMYYLIGIITAFSFKDNRAFCKYLCPVTVFLKTASIFSVLRIAGNKNACNHCKSCVRQCPMSIIHCYGFSR